MIALWMAYSTLITALAGLTAALLEPFARARRVPLRWLWISAIASSLSATLAVAIRPAAPPPASQGGVATGSSSVALDLTGSHAAVYSFDTLLLWGWGIGSLVVGAAILFALGQLSRVRRRARLAELEGTPIAVTQQVGPGAAPFGHPRIFVPAWATALEERAVHLLVLHEREHLRAGDPRWLLSAMVFWALTPWNVALWWCVRRLRCAMEIDCDARVLRADRDVQSYGELLLLVASYRSHPRLTALLTFAESSSPLERRIRTMTDRRTLHPLRASASGAAAILSIVMACETPRPAPVAPTKGAAEVVSPSIVLGNDTGSEARRSRLTAQLKAAVPISVLAASQHDPLLLVISPLGTVLRAARLVGVDEGTKMPMAMMGVEPEAIESVDVLRGAWLPPEASGGVIYVKLKVAGSQSDGGGVTALPKEPHNKVPVVERVLSKDEASQFRSGAPLVEVRDASDHVLFSKRLESAARMTPAGSALDELPAAADDIARVEVTKPAGVVRIWLKPGAALRERK